MRPSRICTPRWATRRRPERPTFGGELADIGRALGQPFMPHQRLIADVGGEYDPDTGLPYYREVVVTVPRQTGKTTLFLSWQIHRCTSPRWSQPQRSAFTAQSGKDARDKWLDELFPLIRRSRRLRPLVDRINQGMGNESLRFRNGSLIRLLSTSASSGHSKSLHQAVLDEVWHDGDDRREQALRPAMITIRDAQLLVCSTAGTDLSVVLNRKVETGRAAVQADTGHGVAYFEWSAPNGWDQYDDGSHFEFHPALCPDPPCRCAPPGEGWRHTITLDVLRAERDSMEPAEYRRAYGNLKTSTERGLWQVIPEQSWSSRHVGGFRLADPVALAADITPDRNFAAVASAGRRTTGGRGVELIDHHPGEGWVIPRLVELVERHKPCVVVTSDRALRDKAAAEAGLSVHLAGAGDMASAAAMFFDGIAGSAADVHHLGSPCCEGRLCLDEAVAGASKRPIGDAWAWDRRSPSVDICPLVAASLALWGLASPRVHQPRRGVAVASVDTGPTRRERKHATSSERDVADDRLREQIERDLARSG